MAHFVPYNKTSDASYVVDFYFKEIVKLHSVPKTIISGHDSKFVSHFWRVLWRKLETTLQFTSSYHPQIGGQIEVVNQSLENLLRSFVGKTLGSQIFLWLKLNLLIIDSLAKLLVMFLLKLFIVLILLDHLN